ncbi:MAG: histidinol dehydrogenase [Acidilobaceae archaeon]
MRVFEVSSRESAETLARAIRLELDYDRYIEAVKPIVADVRKRGDDALIDYAERLDGVKLTRDKLSVEKNELEIALSEVEAEKPALVDSLRKLADRVRSVERPLSSIAGASWTIRVDESIVVEEEVKPIDSVACYVPGAMAPYISTAVMCGATARIAGVRRVVAFTPPRSLSKSLLAALAITGFDKLYLAGGAYGVAALAYGTQSVERVSKIAGPGGPYYTAAKILVSRDVGIDMLAGPTELVVYVDKRGLEREIALHLAAQAEHGESSTIVAVTRDREVAANLLRVYEDISEKLYAYTRGKLATPKIVVADSLSLVAEFINYMSPEHVEICSDSGEIVDMIENYGVLIDGCVSTAINDYYSGVNHILPTSGWARWRGGLSVLDFLVVRRRVKFKGGRSDLEKIAREVEPIAEEEGFPLHLLSIKGGY